MAKIENIEIRCRHCGSLVYWSMPRPTDDCPECGKPIGSKPQRELSNLDRQALADIVTMRSYMRGLQQRFSDEPTSLLLTGIDANLCALAFVIDKGWEPIAGEPPAYPSS